MDAEQLAKSHLKAYRHYRILAQLVVEAHLRQIKDLPQNEKHEYLLNLKTTELEQWNCLLDRSIKGERIATGLDAPVDLTAAVIALKSAGYRILEPLEKQKPGTFACRERDNDALTSEDNNDWHRGD